MPADTPAAVMTLPADDHPVGGVRRAEGLQVAHRVPVGGGGQPVQHPGRAQQERPGAHRGGPGGAGVGGADPLARCRSRVASACGCPAPRPRAARRGEGTSSKVWSMSKWTRPLSSDEPSSLGGADHDLGVRAAGSGPGRDRSRPGRSGRGRGRWRSAWWCAPFGMAVGGDVASGGACGRSAGGSGRGWCPGVGGPRGAVARRLRRPTSRATAADGQVRGLEQAPGPPPPATPRRRPRGWCRSRPGTPGRRSARSSRPVGPGRATPRSLGQVVGHPALQLAQLRAPGGPGARAGR